jgi:molecular chaperone IbpA
MIEIAVAGFKQEDLDVQLQNRTLTVTGKAPEDTNTYLYKGLASRAFTSTFSLAERVDTTGVLLQDGLLKIFLKYIVPEELKPKKLEINSNMSKLLLG